MTVPGIDAGGEDHEPVTSATAAASESMVAGLAEAVEKLGGGAGDEVVINPRRKGEVVVAAAGIEGLRGRGRASAAGP